MNLATPITAFTSPPSDAVRHNDARPARLRAQIIDVEPVQDYRSAGHAARAYRTVDESSTREQRLPARVPRPRRPQDEETTSLGFAAQHIAQEVLSEGLYFENFRPALAAYSAAELELRADPPSAPGELRDLGVAVRARPIRPPRPSAIPARSAPRRT